MTFRDNQREPVSATFKSFFIAGFECSTHRLRNGKRLDVLAATQHDKFAHLDFERLRKHNMHTIRTGVRWHLIETTPYRYDFSSLLPYIDAVREHGMQPIWDLCHYGYPDDIDIFAPEFVRRFTRFAKATAQVIAQEIDQVPFFCPINEISYWAWAAGDGGYLNPYASNRSFELKQQLVRASISAIDAIREVIPTARFTSIDPIVHLIAAPDRPHEREIADGYRWAQYQAWDMLCGRLSPELGGKPEYLDLIGVNFYANNEWIYEGSILTREHPDYRLFRHLAREIYERYRRPIFIAETGIEGDERTDWLSYMVDETIAVLEENIPLEGLCLYPILCYPGWEDDRYCPSGLWDYASSQGERTIYEPLATTLAEQQQRVQAVLSRKKLDAAQSLPC